MTDEERLTCARFAIRVVMDKIGERLEELGKAQRKTKQIRYRIDELESHQGFLQDSLNNIDEVLDGISVRREAADMATAKYQN